MPSIARISPTQTYGSLARLTLPEVSLYKALSFFVLHERFWGPRFTGWSRSVGLPLVSELLLLWHQQNLAGGLALFHIDLGLGSVRERIRVLGAEFKLALGSPAENIACTPLQLGARGDVMPERGPRQEERTFAVEQARFEGRNRTA